MAGRSAVPLDDDARLGRRRIGPFWIEEGWRPMVVGAAILLAAIILYLIAWFVQTP